MFRAIKKRKPRLVTTARTVDDDDEEEEEEVGERETKNEKSQQQPLIVSKAKLSVHATRRRPRPTTLSFVAPSFLQDDDDEDDTNVGNHKKKKRNERMKKKRGLGFGGGTFSSQKLASSADLEDDDDNADDPDNETLKAATMSYDKTALEQLKSEQRIFKKSVDFHVEDHQLQQATTTTTIKNEVAPSWNDQEFGHSSINNNNGNTSASSPSRPARSEPLPDFISLHDATAAARRSGFGIAAYDHDDDYDTQHDDPMMTVLTGEEAAMMEEKILAGNVVLDEKVVEEMTEKIEAFSSTILSPPPPPPPATTMEQEDSHDWEQQLLRRAGIAPADKNHFAPTSSSAHTSVHTNTAQLREQIQSTLKQLTTQQEDVHVALERRQVDLQHAQVELQRHGAELQQAGQALEYYQELRETLASWVGALRDLQTKLRPLRQARWELELDQSAKTRWRDWENDMVAILRQAQLLQQVLGRQPNNDDDESTVSSSFTTTTVDEFGRDVKSQQVLQREQRYRQRQRIIGQRRTRKTYTSTSTTSAVVVWREDDSDAFCSDGEQHELEERRRALDLAFQVALEEMEEEYTNMANLVSIFVKWSQSYQEDYRNCFANLSLADLAGVLVDKYLNGNEEHHPLHWLDTKNSTSSAATSAFSWLDSLQSPELSSPDKLEESPMYLVFDRVVIPRYLDLLDKSIYSLQSSKQSKSLAGMYGWICRLFPQSHNGPMLSKMKSRTVEYLCQEIQNIAIPIPKAGAWDSTATVPDEVQDAIRCATCGQIHRIVKLLRNVLKYWAPHLQDSQPLTATVLEFCSTKLLFLLSSLQAASSVAITKASSPFLDVVPPSPRECFAEIYHALQPTKWLDQPEYMLQGASIRAAAIAYGINPTPTA